MKMPKLKFKFDPKRDLEIARYFYNNSRYADVDFWKKGALRYHNELKIIEKKQGERNYLSDYVTSIYKQHQNEFEFRKKEIEALYKNKEQKFFCESKKIFKNNSWPKGKYVAYLSIFDFCPRFLDDKTFFIFMYDNDKDILFTIFHEMLHFIFYDYCLTKYPTVFKSQDTENGRFWELAELFNSVVQQTPPFVKLHGRIEGIGYPKIKLKFKEAKKSWNGDVDDWIATFGMKHIKNL